jgi:hypothetical protein
VEVIRDWNLPEKGFIPISQAKAKKNLYMRDEAQDKICKLRRHLGRRKHGSRIECRKQDGLVYGALMLLEIDLHSETIHRLKKPFA